MKQLWLTLASAVALALPQTAWAANQAEIARIKDYSIKELLTLRDSADYDEKLYAALYGALRERIAVASPVSLAELEEGLEWRCDEENENCRKSLLYAADAWEKGQKYRDVIKRYDVKTLLAEAEKKLVRPTGKTKDETPNYELRLC